MSRAGRATSGAVPPVGQVAAGALHPLPEIPRAFDLKDRPGSWAESVGVLDEFNCFRHREKDQEIELRTFHPT